MQDTKTKVYAARVSPLADKERFERLLAALPSWRQRRVYDFAKPEDRQRLLGAGVLLKIALAAEGVDLCAAEVVFQNGKPFLAGQTGYHFNLSHSGKWVMCAVGSAPVGCDLQQPRPLSGDIAARFFTSEERDLIAAAPNDAAARQTFFRLWSLKESYVKAMGQGLSLPLSSFSVLPPPDGTPFSQNIGGKIYYFREYAVDGYAAACCSERETFEDPLHIVDFGNM